MSKKILHIIDNLGLGGAQTVVKGIFEKQVSNKDLYLFSIRKENISVKVNHENVIKNKSKFKYCFPIFKLKKIIKDNNIEILHCHLAKSQIIGGLLKFLFFPNIKLVFHEHGEIFEDDIIYPFFMNLFRNKVDLYIAVSNEIKNQILKKTNFNETKIIVLYNFVDLEKFKKIEDFNIKKEKLKFNLKKDDFVIGFASRFIKRKGWLELLKAAKILKKKGYDFKFLIAGDGIDKEKIINYIIDNKLQNNIKMIGYIKNMNEFYNLINVFVLPSHWEGLAMAQLETLASGTVLISSDGPGLNEIIENNKNALVFKKQDENDLVSKIIEIFENKKTRDKLVKSGLKEVKKFDLKKYIIELNNIYK